MLCFVCVRGVRGGVWVHACVGCGWSGRCAGVQARLVGKDQELWPHINTARSAAVGVRRGWREERSIPYRQCTATPQLAYHYIAYTPFGPPRLWIMLLRHYKHAAITGTVGLAQRRLGLHLEQRSSSLLMKSPSTDLSQS